MKLLCLMHFHLEIYVRQRGRLNICCYIDWIDKYCICQFNQYNYKYWDGSAVQCKVDLSDDRRLSEHFLLKSKIEVLSQESAIYGLSPIASLRLISAMTGGRSTVVGITKWAPAWDYKWSRWLSSQGVQQCFQIQWGCKGVQRGGNSSFWHQCQLSSPKH